MKKNGKDNHEDVLKETLNEGESVVTELKERGRALLNDSIKGAKNIYEDRAKQIKHKAEQISDKSVDEITDEVKHYVQKNPVKSLAVAVGVGVILGFIFKSDS